MGIRRFRTRQILVVTFFLFLILLVGFPGTVQAVKPMEPPLCVPQAFQKLGASVVGLRFYASQSDKIIPMQARTYNTTFSNDTPYIWWELCLNNKAKRNSLVPLYTWVVWQRPDGSEFTQSIAANIPAGLQRVCLSAYGQDKRPGGWPPGAYRVSIQIDDIEVASGSFDVIQKFLGEN